MTLGKQLNMIANEIKSKTSNMRMNTDKQFDLYITTPNYAVYKHKVSEVNNDVEYFSYYIPNYELFFVCNTDDSDAVINRANDMINAKNNDEKVRNI